MGSGWPGCCFLGLSGWVIPLAQPWGMLQGLPCTCLSVQESYCFLPGIALVLQLGSVHVNLALPREAIFDADYVTCSRLAWVGASHVLLSLPGGRQVVAGTPCLLIATVGRGLRLSPCVDSG